MAQSTEHLQSLLHDMGFSPPPQMPPSTSHTKDLSPETVCAPSQQPNTKPPAEEAVGNSAQARQELPRSATSADAQQTAAAAAASGKMPQDVGGISLPTSAPKGSSCSSAGSHRGSGDGTCSPDATVTGSSAETSAAGCTRLADSGAVVDTPLGETSRGCNIGSAQNSTLDSHQALPPRQPRLATQPAGTPNLWQSSEVQADASQICSRSDDRSCGWQAPGQDRPFHPQVCLLSRAPTQTYWTQTY